MAIQTKTMTVKSDTALAETTTTIRDTVTFDTSKLPNGITYKGLKAVLSFADPIQWNKASTYDSLTVVWDDATHSSYASKRPVPQNIELTNEFYWFRTADLDAQVEMYRQEVQQFDGRIKANAQAIAANTAKIESMSISVKDVISTTSEFKNCDKQVGELVSTLGFSKPSDGGGAVYEIKSGVEADNISSFETINGVAVIKYFHYIESLGAISDGNHDCTSAFKKCHDLNHDINLFSGTYLINALTLTNKTNIYGNGCIIKSNSTDVVIDCDWNYSSTPAVFDNVNLECGKPNAVVRIGHNTLHGNLRVRNSNITIKGGVGILQESSNVEIFNTDFFGDYYTLTDGYAVKSTGGSDSKIIDVSCVNLKTPFDVVCGYYWVRVHPWIRPSLVTSDSIAFTIRSNEQYMNDCYADSYGTDIKFYGGAIKAEQFFHFSPDDSNDILHTASNIYLINFDDSYLPSNAHRLNINFNILGYPGYNYQNNIKVSNKKYPGITFNKTQANDMPSNVKDIYSQYSPQTYDLKDSVNKTCGKISFFGDYVQVNINYDSTITPPISAEEINDFGVKVVGANMYDGNKNLYLSENCTLTGNIVDSFHSYLIVPKKYA